MLLMGCQVGSNVALPHRGQYPFTFHEATKQWLKSCESSIKPPVEAIVDFNDLKKRYQRDKLLYNSKDMDL
jgi:hypothetical protein